MTFRGTLRVILLSTCITILFHSFVVADTRMTIESSRPKVTVGAMVMPAAVETTTIWLGDGRARIDRGDGTSMIYNKSTKMAFKLFPKFNLYQKTDFAATEEATDSVTAENDLMAGLSRLVEDSSTHVEATADTSTLHGYLCRKYIVHETKVSMITVYKTSEVWATNAILVDFELYRIIANISELISRGSLNDLKELMKVEGVTVKRIGHAVPAADPDSIMPPVTIAGDDRSELLNAEVLPAPAGLYDLPEGYELSTD